MHPQDMWRYSGRISTSSSSGRSFLNSLAGCDQNWKSVSRALARNTVPETLGRKPEAPAHSRRTRLGHDAEHLPLKSVVLQKLACVLSFAQRRILSVTVTSTLSTQSSPRFLSQGTLFQVSPGREQFLNTPRQTISNHVCRVSWRIALQGKPPGNNKCLTPSVAVFVGLTHRNAVR